MRSIRLSSPSRLAPTFALALAAVVSAAGAAPPAKSTSAPTSLPELEALGRIRDEGFRRSQVKEIVHHLTDVIGPRLTGSPGMRTASEWTKSQFAEWGLTNAHLETWDFGEGWSFSRAEVRQTKPVGAVLAALPKAWSVGTNGPVRGRAKKLKLESAEDLDEVAGELEGTILFVDDAPKRAEPTDPLFKRWDAERLEALYEYDVPKERDREVWRERRKKQRELWQAIASRLVEEGVVAIVEASSFDYGIVRTGGTYTAGIPGLPPGPPQLTMAMDPYARILRMVEDGEEVELEVDVAVEFHRDTTLAANTIAEIPGTTRAGEIVMAGAHLDSWHPGTGATDNAAGSAVVMEAMRILKALDFRPKRTIRAALWSGEEQGLLGSRAYVAEHFASRPAPTDPDELALPERWRETTWPITTKPEHKSVAVYFNLDNGGGKVRGVYAQENLAAKAKLERWIEPLADLGVTTVTMENTGSTDHAAFDGVGIPGFQFVQDERDYGVRTHHSNLDTFDRLDMSDLEQAAVVMASMIWQAAMDEAPFPRKPMPTEPQKKRGGKGDGERAKGAKKPSDEATKSAAPAGSAPSAPSNGAPVEVEKPASAETPGMPVAPAEPPAETKPAPGGKTPATR